MAERDDRVFQSRMAERDDRVFQSMGFCVHRRPSSVPLAGLGVFVTRGRVPKGTVVAMYPGESHCPILTGSLITLLVLQRHVFSDAPSPGTVYEVYEPVFFQSLRNPFVFRCIDGVLVDGNDKGISKLVYK